MTISMRRLACWAALALAFAAGSGGAVAKELTLLVQNQRAGPSAALAAAFIAELAVGGDAGVSVVRKLTASPDVPGSAFRAAIAGDGDLAVLAVDDLAEDIPAVEMFSYPFAFRDEAMIRAFAARGSAMRGMLEAAMLNGLAVRPLLWQPAEWSEFASRRQVAGTPAAIRTKHVGVPGRTVARWISDCGGIAVPVAEGALASQFDVGTLEVGLTGHEQMAAFDLWGKIGAMTDSGILLDLSMLVIREPVWQSLSAAERASLQAAAERVEQRLWDELGAEEARHQAMVETHKLAQATMTAAELDEWKLCSSDVVDTYGDRAGALGAEFLAAYRALLQSTDATAKTSP